MNLKKTIKKKNLHKEYLKIMNGVLQLSYREAEILSLLLKIDLEWKPIMPTDFKNIISTDNRRKVMSESRINKNNLSKYIAMFKDKGLIVTNSFGGYEISKRLLPDISKGYIDITFILEIDEDQKSTE